MSNGMVRTDLQQLGAIVAAYENGVVRRQDETQARATSQEAAINSVASGLKIGTFRLQGSFREVLEIFNAAGTPIWAVRNEIQAATKNDGVKARAAARSHNVGRSKAIRSIAALTSRPKPGGKTPN